MSLFVGLFTGLLGTGYIIYGRKQQRVVPLLAGIALCVVPFVLNGWLLSSIVSVVLAALPFFIAI